MRTHETQAQPKFSSMKKYAFHGVIWSLVLLLSFTAAAGQRQPLVSMLARDKDTLLYTISIKEDSGHRSPLVVDLAGSLIWSTCPSTAPHSTVPCESGTCSSVRKQSPHGCRYVDGGSFWANRVAPARWSGSQGACTAHPVNPVTGECSTGDLTSFSMSANTTNGTHVLYSESFITVGACAPDRLLRSLPEGATGVAGFSRRPLSLPSQLAAQRGSGDKFSLCLPAFATFGDTPVYLPIPDPRGSVDYTRFLRRTPLLKNPRNDGYYIPVKGISVSWNDADAAASLSAGALDLDVGTGRGGVVLSTTTPYMTMRADVFRALVVALDDVITRGKMPTAVVERVAAPKPFEVCYKGGFPRLKQRNSYDVPTIILELGAGATGNWTLDGDNCLVDVGGGAFCLAVVPVKGGEPAVVMGVTQLENNLLEFDREKGVLGFSGLLDFQLSGCTSANLLRNQ